jgi:hypothetical protein
METMPVQIHRESAPANMSTFNSPQHASRVLASHSFCSQVCLQICKTLAYSYYKAEPRVQTDRIGLEAGAASMPTTFMCPQVSPSSSTSPLNTHWMQCVLGRNFVARMHNFAGVDDNASGMPTIHRIIQYHSVLDSVSFVFVYLYTAITYCCHGWSTGQSVWASMLPPAKTAPPVGYPFLNNNYHHYANLQSSTLSMQGGGGGHALGLERETEIRSRPIPLASPHALAGTKWLVN